MIYARNGKVRVIGTGRELLTDFLDIKKKLCKIMHPETVKNAEEILKRDRERRKNND